MHQIVELKVSLAEVFPINQPSNKPTKQIQSSICPLIFSQFTQFILCDFIVIFVVFFQAIASTISTLIPTHGAANSDEEKRVLTCQLHFVMPAKSPKQP